MTGFFELRVRRSVRLLAAAGALFGASLGLGWTPLQPWAPAATILNAASDWPPTAPFVNAARDALVGVVRWELVHATR